MLAISRHSEVEIWDTSINKILATLVAAEEVDNMSFSSESDRIAVVSDFIKVCQIFSLPSGEIVYSEEFMAGYNTAVFQHRAVGVVLL